jgi:uncharacterized protein YndB with AHSA1/START domain
MSSASSGLPCPALTAVPRGLNMRTWNATVVVRARPERVLETLTDPSACTRWSGVEFEVEDLDEPLLQTGSRARVTGRLVGRRVAFDLEIHRADARRLMLCATGPVELHANYSLRPSPEGCVVEASVSMRPRVAPLGLASAGATAVLLSTGGLRHALGRLAHEAERCADCRTTVA